ncbi:MAG: hypothetical protein M3388_17895 [Acidobacteriota bacterium]|nr:hypothetical protein [Acidobacteriota bacterium]
MSKYMSFESEAFANRALLVAALKEMGFEKIEVTRNAGEYRGSSNQPLIYYPILRYTNEQRTNEQ